MTPECGVAHVSCFKVPEGGVASLSCQYSVKRFGLSRVCWGRGCGTLWCSNILIQTDENGVISKADDRYRLTGDVLEGQMDLDIADVRRSDSGPYCCRVDIDGLFNDKKVIMNLRVVKGVLLWIMYVASSDGISSSLQKLFASQVVNPSATLSLHVNVPVLSLSLTVLITLAAVFLSLAFKRTFSYSSSPFSSEEPPHIIYEIRMRRPVQENIYTLD
uniref:Ig-like domain-containing protein n=1 Tax=Hippocampus comes TaxID=109280 RepID=A0A3Q3DS71_HIPCM